MPAACYLPLTTTRRFSALVLDYVSGKEALNEFVSYRPDEAGLKAAIEARKDFPVDREALADVLSAQYRHLPYEAATEQSIGLLRQEHTFTICTAHQPNLATGYLYFVYKILHAVKLAQQLSAAYPQYRFVPVYYMGSEDADLEELGTFRFGEQKFVWDAGGQTGAVGRMSTATLEPLLQELFALFGPPGHNAQELEHLLREAYGQHDTIAKATQYLVHRLFGKYGLLVLDPDDARLKRSFIPVMEEDLRQHIAERIVAASIKTLETAGYKAQAHPRSINLFYLKDALRERIELRDGAWRVLNSDISWSEAQLLQELKEHPDRFSPNVMLRPLYQETILPNIAFIGGGAEVAYWLQLRALFGHHKVFYPAIILRQSVMWMSAAHQKLKAQTGLTYETLFAKKDEAAKTYITERSESAWQAIKERDSLEVMLSSLRERAAAIDPTLRQSADATLAKMTRQLASLEAKMLRALKRKESTTIERIDRLQGSLFPGGGLGERVENFMPYYLQFGAAFFEELLQAMDPLRQEFLILESAS